MTLFRFFMLSVATGMMLAFALTGCIPSNTATPPAPTLNQGGTPSPAASPVYTAPPETYSTPTQVGLTILPSETTFDPLPLPTGTPYTYRAHYQAFERGFMAHAEDATCAYMFVDDGVDNYIIIPDSERAEPFGEYHYCTEFAELPTAIPAESAPSGLTLPADPFARLWVRYPEAREALGYATLGDEWYSVTVFPSAIPIGFGGAPWQQPVIGLPDGRTLQCGFRAATAGQCSL